MKHIKYLIIILIIGIRMHMMTVVTSAVFLDEETEQQVIIGESQASIPVQGYIIPLEEEIKEPVIPEQPKEPQEPEGQEVPKFPEGIEVREIPNTVDVRGYYKYVLMSILSILWIFILCSFNEEEKLEE